MKTDVAFTGRCTASCIIVFLTIRVWLEIQSQQIEKQDQIKRKKKKSYASKKNQQKKKLHKPIRQEKGFNVLT